jgi:nucleoside-triphosphate--adenylate kinase
MMKDFNLYHVSTGDLLRKHVKDNTSIGKEAEKFMLSGSLVPDKYLFDILKVEMTKSQDPMLIDGFPRTVEQARILHELMVVEGVLSLDVPHQIVIDRISDRWIHSSSGRTYSYSYNPPLKHGFDDVTGEPLMQRKDDQPEAVRKRLELYEEMKKPVLDYYEKLGGVKVARFAGSESDVIYPLVHSFIMREFKL